MSEGYDLSDELEGLDDDQRICRGFEDGCWCDRCKEKEGSWFMAPTPLRWILYCTMARLVMLFLKKRATWRWTSAATATDETLAQRA